MALVAKLLAVVALLFMPAGMSAAAASPPHAAPAAMPMAGHCGDRAPGQAPKSSGADCAVGCTAIPATQARPFGPLPTASLPLARPIAPTFSGIDPETATPPPKRA